MSDCSISSINRKAKRKMFLATVALLPAARAIRASAAVETWAPGGTVGGSATWDTSTANWLQGGATTTWTNGNDGTFGGTAGTVTVAPGGINLEIGTFSTSGYVLSGGSINLTSSTVTPEIYDNGTLTATVGVTINSVLTGSAGAQFIGRSSSAGSITLGGANSYTGASTISLTNVYYSVLAVGGSNSSFGASSVATGTVDIGGSGSAVNVIYTGSGGTTDRPWVAVGTSSGNTISNNGTGAISFTNAGSAVGGTLANRGLTFGGTAAFVNSFAEPIGNLTGFTTQVGVSGSTWQLTGSNTYTGATTLSGGTLQLSTADSGTFGPIGNGGSINFTNGALQYSSLNQADYSSRIAAGTSTKAVAIDTNGQSVQFSTALNGTLTGSTTSGVVGGLTKFGSGTLILAASNGYLGTTTIAGGTLQADATDNGTIGPLGAGGAINFSGGTLQYSSANNYDYSARIAAGTSASPVSIDTNGTNVNFGTPLTASQTGGLTKIGAGALTVNGASAYKGVTTIAGGILSTGSSGTLAAGGSPSSIGAGTYSQSYLVLNGGTLQYANIGPAESTDHNFTLGANGGTIDASGANLISFTNTNTISNSGTGADTLTLTGSGSGSLSPTLGASGTSAYVNSLTKNGTGIWYLVNNSTYTGVTTINSGTLSTGSVGTFADAGTSSSFGKPANIGASTAAMVLNGGALQYANTGAAQSTNRLFTIGVNGGTLDASGTNAITFSNNGTLGTAGTNSSPTLGLSGTGAGIFAPIIGNDGMGFTSLTQSGGNWTLLSTSTYTGATTINAGTLQLTTGALSTSSTITDNGNLTFNRSTTVAQGTDFSAASITGSGSVTQLGTSTLSLSSANGYSGGTNINAGFIAIAQSSSLGSGSVNFTGSAQINATAALTLNNAVTGASSSVTASFANFTPAASNTTFLLSSLISGPENVKLLTIGSSQGGPIDISNNSNSFTGSFSTGAGFIKYTSVAMSGTPSALGEGTTPFQISNGSSYMTFQFIGSSAGTESTDRAINWAGTSGNLALDASGAGPLQFLSTAALRSGVGANTLVLQGSNTGQNVLAASINDSTSGATSLTKTTSTSSISGAGNWTLTGSSTYTGTTTISMGTLTIDATAAATGTANASASIAGSGSISITGGGLHLLNSSGSPGGAVSMLSTTANVSIGSSAAPLASGSAYVTLDLNGQTQTINTFSINGVFQPIGVYGSAAYFTDQNINPNTQQKTDEGYFGVNGDGAFNATNAPEPTGFSLLAFGCIGWLGRRRRRGCEGQPVVRAACESSSLPA